MAELGELERTNDRWVCLVGTDGVPVRYMNTHTFGTRKDGDEWFGTCGVAQDSNGFWWVYIHSIKTGCGYNARITSANKIGDCMYIGIADESAYGR